MLFRDLKERRVNGIIYPVAICALVAQWIERLVADQKVCAFESRRGCQRYRPPHMVGDMRSGPSLAMQG
jgi:hypothetical protein